MAVPHAADETPLTAADEPKNRAAQVQIFVNREPLFAFPADDGSYQTTESGKSQPPFPETFRLSQSNSSRMLIGHDFILQTLIREPVRWLSLAAQARSYVRIPSLMVMGIGLPDR